MLDLHIGFFVLRVLVDTVVHFPTSLEELTVTVSDDRMWVRNHVEDEAGEKICSFFFPLRPANTMTCKADD